MAIEIKMPSLSAGMEQGHLSRWLKKEGETVTKGEILAEIETDKATMELEAEADGRIEQILVSDGVQDVPVGRVIALLLADGETLVATSSADLEPALSRGEPVEVAHISVLSDDNAGRTTKRHASPLARRLAQDKGVDLSKLEGSGPRGRIVRIDIERAVARTAPSYARNTIADILLAKPAATPTLGSGDTYEAVPHSNIRKVIARRLLEAKTTIPHFYLTVDCEIDALLKLRAELNAMRGPADKISVNDFIIKASAQALSTVPSANAIWTDDAIHRLKSIDISVAVATDDGLITPIVRNAEQKSIGTISAEIRSLAQKARANKLRPEEYQGGGFSVSNLGMYGIGSFSAIINPPQSCILAVGAAARRPICRNEDIVAATVLTCTLSVDHRSVDGALGAKLLGAFKGCLESPLALLV